MKINTFWLEQSNLLNWQKKPSFAYKKKNIIMLIGTQMAKLIYLITALLKILN